MECQSIIEQIKIKKSFLCIGLDTDVAKIPTHFLDAEDPIFEFNKAIIDATHDLCVAYKPNVAFYECHGAKGWTSLKKTIDYIPDGLFIIADAKRGDIGNSSRMYAQTFFEHLGADAVTVTPYMGKDSVMPFLEYSGKCVILLALTSNEGSGDFQRIDACGLDLFQHVLSVSKEWGDTGNMMFVVGATHPEMFGRIRKIVPNHFLLVPGVGAQGGDLRSICEHGLNEYCGLLVNSSRGIIYAGSGDDFTTGVRNAALKLQMEMSQILTDHAIV